VSGTPGPESLSGVIVIACGSPSQATTTVVVPLGPPLVGLAVSTSIWTAVAFSVSHVTVTGPVVAEPQSSS
jgi:hypothetical protein